MTAKEFVSKIPTFKESDLLAAPITSLETLKSQACEKMKYKMELYVTYLQAAVVNKLSEYETEKKFIVDRWNREKGGGGVTCVIQDGETFEKAGVNISVVWGELQPEQVKSMKSRGKDLNLEGKNEFFATGVSSVIHPQNPFIPTMHFNYRYFEVLDDTGKHTWWFGGGCDITPTYLSEEDAIHFHKTQKEACDKHEPSYYPKFKKWADDYFYSPHRSEHRGIGGLFFDDFDEKSMEECFSFITSCGSAIIPSYAPIIEKHRHDKFNDQQRNWQLLRRGRYVEFNLVHDRGTKFGLATPNARIESILMSLPLVARWEYMPCIADGSEEDKIMKVLKKARDWI